MRIIHLVTVVLSTCLNGVDAFSAASLQARESVALCDWLLAENRCSLGPTQNNPSVELGILNHNDQGGVAVTTTRTIVPGEILFRLSSNAIFTSAAAYSDRDLGGKLRDLSVRAGPGFDIVALSGAIAAERIRGYSLRTFQGLAPESAGMLVPSKWGALARWLWSTHKKENEAVLNDQDIAGPIQQGIQLLVPLLDVAARRAWTADTNSKGDARESDASAISWSRSDLEGLARSAFGLVLSLQRPPPAFILEGVGRLVPSPFVASEKPDMWSDCGEALALVPLVDALLCDSVSEANAVIGSPPTIRDSDNILWCVATRELKAGERVLALDPWAGKPS